MTDRRLRLLLFDIDGTLMLAGGAGSRAIDRICRDRFGIVDAFSGISPDGKTDPLLFREVIRRHRLGADAALEAELTASYLRCFAEEMRAAPEARLLPGVAATLEALSRRSDLALGLLTGNLEPSARIKLSRFGIDRFFRFGAFGSDHAERELLVPLAVARAERVLGRDIGLGRHVVVLGDTPLDVACALANGVTAIGVATHRYDAAELEAAGAHGVLEDLRDPGKVVAAVDRLARE